MTTPATTNTPVTIDPFVEHKDGRFLMVSFSLDLPFYTVTSLVKAKHGDEWQFEPVWENVICGNHVVKSNPFQRDSDGRHVWLFLKA